MTATRSYPIACYLLRPRQQQRTKIEILSIAFGEQNDDGSNNNHYIPDPPDRYTLTLDAILLPCQLPWPPLVRLFFSFSFCLTQHYIRATELCALGPSRMGLGVGAGILGGLGVRLNSTGMNGIISIVLTNLPSLPGPGGFRRSKRSKTFLNRPFRLLCPALPAGIRIGIRRK